MDLLKGFEQQQYLSGTLHTAKSGPRSVMVREGEKNLFEDMSARNDERAADMARRRTGSFGGGDVFAAMPRMYTPMDYFETQKIPYNINKEADRFQLYKWLDLFYRTHYLIPILVDIFTRFPLVGLELHTRDKSLKTFYEELFFDSLNYEQFLVDLGREY
jgi:hypothetical protein